MPQLTRRARLPLPVAAGTSVSVVICVALASAAAQMAVIYSEGGAPLPLNLAGLASLLCLQCHSSHVTQSQIKFSWIKRHRVTWRALSVQSPTLVSD